MLHKDWKMGKIFAAFLRRNLLILDSNCKKCLVGYQKGFDPIVELPINYNAQNAPHNVNESKLAYMQSYIL